MPTLYLCHPSHAPAGIPMLHAQAHPPDWLIARAPRHVPALVPQGAEVGLMRRLVRDRQEGRPMDGVALDRYHGLYVSRLGQLARAGMLDPEVLRDDQGEPISGDIAVVCTCAVSEASAGRCHRAWAAEVLRGVAGWRIVLDREEVGAEARPTPTVPGGAQEVR